MKHFIYCLLGGGALCKCRFNFRTKIVNGRITLKVNVAIFSNFPRVFVFFPPFVVSFLPFLTSSSSSGLLYPVALLYWPRVFLLSVQFKRWMLSSIFSSEWQSQQNKKHVKKMSDVRKRLQITRWIKYRKNSATNGLLRIIVFGIFIFMSYM